MKTLILHYINKFFIRKSTWIFTAVTAVFCSLYFFISSRFFSPELSTDFHTFFLITASLSIIYIPLLTSTVEYLEEESSYPYKTVKILTAKLLACMTVFMILLAVLTAVPLTVSYFGEIDVSSLACEYLGILLYEAASFSFCIFVYSLLRKTATAFAVSAVILALTNTVHLLPVYTGINTNLSFLNFFSTVWHFDTFSKGLLDTRDILFFAVFTAAFILAAAFVEEKRKGQGSSYFKKFSAGIFILVVLLLADSSVFYLRLDLTSSKNYSVSDLSRGILEVLDDTLEITYYRSALLARRYPKIRDIEDYLGEYSSFGPKVRFSVTDPVTDEIKEKLELYGIVPQSISSSDSDSATVARVYSGITLTYHGQTEVIPFINTTDNLEYDLTLRLEYLSTKRRRMVQVVTGSSYDLKNDFSYVIPYLEYNGFTPVQTLLPSQSHYTGEESSFTNYINVPLIVLGSSSFEEEDIKALERFILDGGRAFIASQNYTVKIQDDWSIVKGNGRFERMLFTFGIYYDMNPLCDISNFLLSLYSDEGEDNKSMTPREEYVNYPLWPVLLPQENAPKGMTLYWPTSMTLEDDIAQIENFNVRPYLYSSDYSWSLQEEKGSYVTNPFFVPKAPEKPESASKKIVAAEVLKDQELRAIVFANDLAFHSGMIPFSSCSTMDTRSLEFLCDSILKLSGYKGFVSLRNKSWFNHSLTAELSDSIESYASGVYILMILLPLIINLSLGFMISCRRRKIIHENCL